MALAQAKASKKNIAIDSKQGSPGASKPNFPNEVDPSGYSGSMTHRRKKNPPKVLYEALTLDSRGRPVLIHVPTIVHNMIQDVEDDLMDDYRRTAGPRCQKKREEMERQRLRELMEKKKVEEERLKKHLADMALAQAKASKKNIAIDSKQGSPGASKPNFPNEVDPDGYSDSESSRSLSSTHFSSTQSTSSSRSSSTSSTSSIQSSSRRPTQSSSRSPTPSPTKSTGSSARGSPKPQDSSSTQSSSSSHDPVTKSGPTSMMGLSEPIDFFYEYGGEFLIDMSIEKEFKVILTEQNKIYAFTASKHNSTCFSKISIYLL
jgi:hypothetical protein